ncbi:CAAX prenyl protease 2 [Linum grandiflorum]
MEDEEASLSKSAAVLACTAMALLYVAILYAPTLILRLPQPSSLTAFMVRRFVCAAISSVVSIAACALILPVRSMEIHSPSLLGIYGIRMDHIWQAAVYPLSLTSLMYAGSLVVKLLEVMESWTEHTDQGGDVLDFVKDQLQDFRAWMSSSVSNVLAWRNYVVAPITEELVFRACMIPLLLCGGFKPYIVICLCPILFSLAHLNHWMEIYCQHNYSFVKASLVVGLQLGYTVIFGSYASFLFIRTGHLIAPLLAHVFCNYMGLPVFFARKNGALVTAAFAAGIVSFIWLLFPLTQPDLYHDRTDDCRCWHGYCSWD